MTAELHIVGWADFQHYKDRWPPWIKNYTSLLANDDYLRLSGNRRAILHGLWLAYAMGHGKVAASTSLLSNRLGLRVTARDLRELVDAGFITVREVADNRSESARKVLDNSATAPREHDDDPAIEEPEWLNDADSWGSAASAPLAERSNGASPHALARTKEETETEDLRPEGSSVSEKPFQPTAIASYAEPEPHTLIQPPARPDYRNALPHNGHRQAGSESHTQDQDLDQLFTHR